MLVGETTLKKYGFVQFNSDTSKFIFLTKFNSIDLGSSYESMDETYVK
jgi:hypothetical protein